jgi:hypothetical protein
MLSRALQVTGKCYSLVKATSISKPFEAEFPAPHLEQSKAIMDCVQQLPQDWFWRTLLSDQDIWDTSYPASDRSAKTIFSTWIMALTVSVSRIGEMMSDTLRSTQNSSSRSPNCKRMSRNTSYLAAIPSPLKVTTVTRTLVNATFPLILCAHTL